MNILLILGATILYWLGGRDQMKVPFNQKLFRWLGIGILIGLFQPLMTALMVVLTYFVATNVFGYGENHPLRKWLGRDYQWGVYGFMFGLASFPVLGYLSILQACICSAVTFTLLYWSNEGLYGKKIQHQFVEIGIGFSGVILYAFMR